MTSSPTDQNFSVDLHGVVELLSNHLYSGPQVFLRELLQNAVDALTARAESGADGPGSAGGAAGEVSFQLSRLEGRPVISVTDEGLGLTREEAEMFMSVIGRSSKRDEIGMARESLIGQFGVGILSCFAVSDEITVTSQSASGGQPIRWTGRADGTWTVEDLAGSHAVGATVTLVARHGEDRFFDGGFVERHLRMYGELLDHRVWLRPEGQTPILISRDHDALTNPVAPVDEVMALGRDLLGFDPLDAFPLQAPVGQAQGVAYVLPHEPAPNTKRADRVYVKGMLVSAETDRLLPDWAFFVRCLVVSDGLHPTASREELHHDEVLADTRDQLGESLRAQMMRLAETDSARLGTLVQTHHLAMKALAIHDDDFLRLVVDWLPIESAEGRMSFGEFRTRHPVAGFTNTVDEFRQLAPIATAQGMGLLAGGYTHDVPLFVAASRLLDDFTADLVQVEDLFTGFGVLTEAEEAAIAPLVDAVAERIESFDVELAVRRFEPHETPALLAMDDTAFRLRSLRRTQSESADLFSNIVGSMTAGVDDAKPIFCLNIANPIVGRLVRIADDQALVTHSVEVLYLQALLMGHHPLQVSEAALLNTSLSAILDRATDAGAGTSEAGE